MTLSRSRTVLWLIAVLTALAFAAGAPAQQDRKSQSGKESKQAANSRTGCVDERDGRYVLTNDSDLAPIALLQADGFPTEAFAKHLGHKVTVRGVAVPGASQPTFKVRTIAAVSDTCAPQRQME